MNLAYVSYYFAQARLEPSAGTFYVPMICAAAFYSGVSFGLIALSKREYFIQIESIRSTLKRMVAGDRHFESRVAIINYNELGEIAGYVNSIVDNFVQILARISESTNRTAATVGEVRSSHASLIDQVQDLNARVHDIWETVTAITGVARRIRIVAFNATLQASAAGKAGKGFEVVADEIRKLAEETVTATADIDSRVQQIQTASDSLVESAHSLSETVAMLEEISRGNGDTKGRAGVIARSHR